MATAPDLDPTSSPPASSPGGWPTPTRRSPMRSRPSFDREQNQIELIASENIVSRAVLEAQGSVLTNKYAEGYPGRRYYQGCGPSDSVETLAIERAKQLFGCGFANVQPHSGAQANGAVMMALLKPGDTIMGMSLAAGGHLTHGAPPAQSGKWFNAIQYGVRPRRSSGRFRRGRAARQGASAQDDHRRRLGLSAPSRFRPLPRDLPTRSARYLFVDMAHFAGLVAAGEHPTPVRPRPCRHHHHAQDAARPARRHGADR